MKKGLFKSLLILLAIIGMWAYLFTAASAEAFFVNGQIWNTHRSDGLYTNIDISFGADFPGNPQVDVATITVKGPSGTVLYEKGDFEYIDRFSCWSLATLGAPEIGQYTFTVTTASDTGTDTDFQGVIRTIPVPDISTFSPVADTIVTSRTPKFSWGPVDYSKTPLCYRLVISTYGSGDNWIFSTSRTQGMLSCAAPLDVLTAGQALQYRVECHDSPNFNTLQNRSQSDWVPFTTAGTLGHSATPAIDLDTWGAVTFTTTYGTDLYCWVKVIDHDGVSYDGSSHAVSVTFPDEETYTLTHARARNATEGYYDVYMGLDGSPAQAGNYTFTVTDPDYPSTEAGTLVDTLVFNQLNPPDETSFTPTLKDEYITASIDNVEVNEGSHDDFDSYESIEALKSSGKWWWWGGQEPATYASIIDNEGGKAVQFTVDNLMQGQSFPLFVDYPESINSISADITVHDATEGAVSAIPPRARIMGTFYNNGIEDIYAHVSVTKDKVYYTVWGESSGDSLATGDLKTGINLGQTVNAAISWDGTTLSLEADEEPKATYPTTGIVNDPANDVKGIDANILLKLFDTTPTFTWGEVPGASRYRVRIYSDNNSRTVLHGYPGNQTSYTIPPGVLAPHTTYTYRIEAWDAPDPLDVDNVSKTPAYNSDNYMFITGDQAVDPFIDLSSTGVHIWNNELVDPYLSFWIKVHDAQGVPGDIKSVTVQFPSGAEEVLYYDYQQSSTCGIYRTDSFLAIEPGIYTFRVEDKGGHVFEVTEELTPADPALEYPAATSLTHTVDGTAVNFNWDDVTGAAFYRVEIYDEDYRRVYAFPSPLDEFQLPICAYNVPAGLLKENALYRYRITTRAEFFSENVDNGSSSPWMDWMMPTFMTGSITGGAYSPSIDLDNWGAHVAHYYIPGSTDSMYWLAFAVKVTDQDGVPQNIESVRVTYTDPDDGTTTRDLHHIEHISATEGTYFLMKLYENFSDIPQGDFTFVVTDFDGNSNEVEVTDTINVTEVLPIPTGFTPGQDSIVIGTTPEISWGSVTGSQSYTVRIFDEGDSIIHTSDFLIVNTYEIPAGILEVGKTYSYRISAYQEDGSGEEIDNCSSHPLYAAERYHFTVGNTPPGSSVTVVPVDETTGETPVTITFPEVDEEGAGVTELTTSEEGATPPVGFMLGDPPTYYDITTTAEILVPEEEKIEVCVDYTGVSYGDEEQLRFYHYENDKWVDVTSSLDMEDDIICGEVDSLSAFAIFEFEGAQYCTTLGDDPKPSILDQDIFRFEGTEGEEVTIKMAVDPSGSHIGRRATLILKDKISGVRFMQRDRSALPNEINATLPADGEYRIIAAEQAKGAPGMRFRGDYCLTMGSSGGASETLEPTSWVE